MTAAKSGLIIACNVFLSLVIPISFASFATAATLPYSTDVFTIVGSPVAPWTCPACIQVTYMNNNASQVVGIVYGTYHNSLGQTIRISTATIRPDAGGTGNAFLVEYGLLPGQYVVDVFVITPSGIAISNTSVLTVNG